MHSSSTKLWGQKKGRMIEAYITILSYWKKEELGTSGGDRNEL